MSELTTITFSYTKDGTTVTDTHDILVDKIPVSLAISGVTDLDEGENASALVATVTYTDSTTAIVNPIDWASDDAAATIGAGTGIVTSAESVTSDTPATISCSYTEGGITVNDTHVITINDTVKVPVSVAISGPTSIDELDAGSYTAVVTYDDTTTGTVTTTGTWTRDNSAAGSINAATGVFTASEVSGDESVIITFEYTENSTTVSDTFNLIVKDIVPASVAISGPSTVDEGAAAINFGAIVTYNDTSTGDRTTAGTWSIDNITGGTINPTTGQFTPATGFLDDQTVLVTFSYTEDGVTVDDTVTLTVVDKSLPTSATISGSTTATAGDAPINLSANVVFDDATSGDKTTEGTWSSSNAAAGSINPATGVFTPIAQ